MDGREQQLQSSRQAIESTHVESQAEVEKATARRNEQQAVWMIMMEFRPAGPQAPPRPTCVKMHQRGLRVKGQLVPIGGIVDRCCLMSCSLNVGEI